MRTDYITLLLMNMVAGHLLLAGYVLGAMVQPADAQHKYAPAFGLVGLIGLVGGFHMALTWPLPDQHIVFNPLFGEMTVLFAGLFTAAAVAIRRGWSLGPVAAYGVIAALAAMLIGARILHMSYLLDPPRPMTQVPWLTGAGFLLSGLAGPLVALAWRFRANGALRALTALVLTVAGTIWAFIALGAYWMHIGAWHTR